MVRGIKVDESAPPSSTHPIGFYWFDANFDSFYWTLSWAGLADPVHTKSIFGILYHYAAHA